MGEKREVKEKKNSARKIYILADAHAQKSKKLLNYIQLAENYVLFSVEKLFFLAIPIITSRKKVQKERFGSNAILYKIARWQRVKHCLMVLTDLKISQVTVYLEVLELS